MTLREWYDFNKPVWLKGDMIVTIARVNNCNKYDKLMEALLQNTVAVELFGDLELKSVLIDTAPGTDYVTFNCFLWKPDCPIDEDVKE